MKRLFFVFIFVITPVILSATIDERKTDVYFVNGILTTPEEAFNSVETMLKPAIIEKYGMNYYNQHISKVDYAYNTTLDRSKDMYEAYMQLSEEDPDFIPKLQSFWGRFFSNNAIKDINAEIADAKVYETMIKEVHDADLQKQIESYKSSIDSGHGVVVVAHSQGTLFTNEAYSALTSGDQNSWRKDFFKAFYVAPAATKVLEDKKHSPAFVFDHDPISRLATHFGFHETINPNKYKKAVIGQFGGTSYVNYDNEVFHYFSYYMGKPITYTDDAGEYTVSTDLAKTEVLNFIDGAIKEHNTAPSQWKKKEETGCGCNKRITLTHQYSASTMDSLVKDADIIAFNEDGKLYSVDGHYVKASPTGTKFIDDTANLETNGGICYTLENSGDPSITGSPKITPKDGAVEVYLNWKSADIDLDLELINWEDVGEYDLQDTGCPSEHFVIEDEVNVKAGHYFVNVTPKDISKIDDNISEEVSVIIKALDKNDVYKFNITKGAKLDLGNIAEIIINKNNVASKPTATVSPDPQFTV
ncbi:MAG: hypothetical protein ABXS93_09325, partial [Sulfurimonas sp.]